MDDKHFSSRSSLKVSVNVNGCGGIPSANVTVEKGIAQSLRAEIREVYRPIKEDNLTPTETEDKKLGEQVESESSKKQQLNGDTKMVQEEDTINDGADEQMLGSNDNEKLAEKCDEVKFIKGDHQNGDAKIDIGTVNTKTFTGMTKDELMKYANDPFWVRLRWIFFVLFWGIWVAMLVGAILIIINAPKCAAPTPLPWYKQGPLAKCKSIKAVASDVDAAKRMRASGVIYELLAEETYSVKDPVVEEKIKSLINTYKDSAVNVILDITPNYVTKESNLMKNALSDKSKRSAFIWLESAEVPNNWLSTVNGSAWSEVQTGHFVLSQFGDGLYDLHMNDSIVKKELSEVLEHLIHLGVKGFRFKNTKYFLLTKNIEDEVPSDDPKFIHTQYGFWTHSKTTFQEGLGDVLYEYMVVVKNASTEAFLSVNEDTIRPEVYLTKTSELGIDLPIYGRFAHSLISPNGKNLYNELQNTMRSAGNGTWLQWVYEDADDKIVAPSAYSLFMSLLPGVPVIPSLSDAYQNISDSTLQHIDHLRLSSSYMHGDFDLYQSDEIVAYSRIKSGNPGYFVAFNPTDSVKTGNFTGIGLPDKMTVDVMSENYNITDVTVKSKVMTDLITVSPYATLILTYVPVKSG